jgi:hypothetical protein
MEYKTEEICFEMEEHNLETFFLLWLDASVNSLPEKIKIQPQFRALINQLRTFEDENECERYIRSSSSDDRIVLIVTGQLGRQLIPRIHQLRQVCSIYIFSMDRKKHSIWINQYTKVNEIIFISF